MRKQLSASLCSLLIALAVGAMGAPALPQSLDDATRLILEAREMARTGKYRAALGALQESLTLAEQSGSALTAAVAFNNMAAIYLLQDDGAAAVNAARRAWEIYADMGNEPGIALSRRLIEAVSPGSTAGVEAPDMTREHRIRQAIDRVRQRVEAREEDKIPASGPDRPEYRAYLAEIKKAIVGAWHSPEVTSANRQQGKVGVRFTILQNGAVDDLRILRPSNFLPLNIEAMRAVKSAAPFPPIPQQLGFTQIHIEFTFNYVLPGTGEGVGGVR